MKILIVADGGNIHTKRWAAALADAGVETVLFSLTPAETGFYSGKGVILHVFDLFSYKQGGKKPFLKAIARHSKAVRELKRLIKKENRTSYMRIMPQVTDWLRRWPVSTR